MSFQMVQQMDCQFVNSTHIDPAGIDVIVLHSGQQHPRIVI